MRTGDIPIVFKGYNYITIKLFSSNLEQIQNQMKYRPNNGLIDYELQEKINTKNIKRPPLINEYEIDIAGLSPTNVFHKAVDIIDHTEALLDFEYTKPDKEMFYSWVFSNGLR